MADTVLWTGRKRTLFGLPFSFTKYTLTEEKLIIEIGFLNRREEEIRLYRIQDVSLLRPLHQRIWGLGTIHICSSDRTAPEISIRRIKKSRIVKELLSDTVESERDRKLVNVREFMSGNAGELNVPGASHQTHGAE